jgi:hypothetical protein
VGCLRGVKGNLLFVELVRGIDLCISQTRLCVLLLDLMFPILFMNFCVMCIKYSLYVLLFDYVVLTLWLAYNMDGMPFIMFVYYCSSHVGMLPCSFFSCWHVALFVLLILACCLVCSFLVFMT